MAIRFFFGGGTYSFELSYSSPPYVTLTTFGVMSFFAFPFLLASTLLLVPEIANGIRFLKSRLGAASKKRMELFAGKGSKVRTAGESETTDNFAKRWTIVDLSKFLSCLASYATVLVTGL